MPDTTTSFNQAYFNKLAPDYDEKFQKTIGRLQEELQKRSLLLGVKPGGRLLDYACGTGLVTRALGAELSQCVGIDISESMVQRYNANATSDGLPLHKRSAYVGNLVSPRDASPAAFASPNFFNFDLAGVVLGFHHVDDCGLAAKRLAERLKPGGSFFIMDFVSHAPLDHNAASQAVRHHGFTRDQIKAIFDEAGVGNNFRFEVLESDIWFDHAHGSGNQMARRVFFARGDKPCSASAQM